MAGGDGRKTIFFEEKYGVEISQFRSISDVDSFVEKKLGRKLEVRPINSNIVSKSGNLFRIVKYDVQGKFRRMLGI